MSVTPGYYEVAKYCPPWIPAPAPLDVGAAYPASPLTYEAVTTNQSSGTAQAINRNNRRNEIIAQHGGAGACAVFYGLDLSVSAGLTLAYSAGGAMCNGPQVKASAGTLALAGSAWSWIYITSGGAVTAVSGTNRLEIPDPPTASCAFLGRVLCDSGNILEIDYSGRQVLRGGVLWRRTADEGMPGDEPGATTLFMHRTESGVWQWDGVEYFGIENDTSDLQDTIEDLQDQLDEQGYVFRQLLRQYVELLGDVPQDPILQAEWLRAVGEE